MSKPNLMEHYSSFLNSESKGGNSQTITGGKKDPEIGEDGVHLITRQPSSEHTKVRKIYIRKENNWKYINISFFLEWRIRRQPNMIGCKVIFNGIEVKCTNKTDTYYEYNFKKIREKWFDCLGMTELECQLIALEDICMVGQLESKKDFTIPIDLAKGCIYSKNLMIYILPEWKARTTDHSTILEVEEEYVVSDIHKQQDKEKKREAYNLK